MLASQWNTWTQNADGSVDFNGTVHFPNGTNLASGVGVAIFGPGGGQANWGAIAQGDPGLPPVVNFSYSQVPNGTALPAVNPAVLLVSPGGPGVASVYDVTIYGNEGGQGDDGPNSVIEATDVVGTPAAGDTLVYEPTAGEGSTPAAQWQAPKVGGWYSATGIGATAESTTNPRTLDAIGVPPQPWPWVPEVLAQSDITNGVDTQVDLIARIGDAEDGDQCGYAQGPLGGSPTVTMIPAFGEAMPGTSGYAQVPAGQAATIYLVAAEQASSANSWATGNTTFSVKVTPVP